MKILVTPTSMQSGSDSAALKKLSAYCPDLVFNPTGKPLEEDKLIDLGWTLSLKKYCETARI